MVNSILCGDSVEGMKAMPDDYVDLTVTSPPYDNLRKYDGFCWDFEETARQLFRITKPGGVVVWVVSDATINGSETGTSFRQALFFMEVGFRLHDTMLYKRWSGPLTHNRYEQEFEYMFVFSKGRPKTFNPIMVKSKWYGKEADRTGQIYPVHDEVKKKLRSGKNRVNIKEFRIDGNVWEIKNSSQAAERYGHPAPFPEELARRHIISWSNEGDLILDPFLGSGTTAKVAVELGRNYIGLEASKKYCEVAQKRIDDFLEKRTNDKDISGSQ